jgi:pimeloyl-ACP methyl ester carboxylesterase
VTWPEQGDGHRSGHSSRRVRSGPGPWSRASSRLRSHFVGADGARLHVLVGGDPMGTVVCLVHGNLSSARFFEPLAAHLPPTWRLVAPDLRGFGRSDPAPVDATRGMSDFADDLARVLADGELVPPVRRQSARPVHLLGWSMGGGVVMRYAMDHPDRVASVTLVAPLSPFGFGGTKDVEGTLCYEDGAGAGAGTVAPDLVQRLTWADRTAASNLSARSLLRSLYVRPPRRLPSALEDLFVDEILRTALGEDNYPGDRRASNQWPGVAPGVRGVVNAMSPLYCNLSGFAGVVAVRPTLWVRGADDKIVSDHSMLDLGQLGRLGLVPDWPGDRVFPPQPMVAQTRSVLRHGGEKGGTVVESVFTRCAHAPHLEQPERFQELFTSFVATAEASAR